MAWNCGFSTNFKIDSKIIKYLEKYLKICNRIWKKRKKNEVQYNLHNPNVIMHGYTKIIVLKYKF